MTFDTVIKETCDARATSRIVIVICRASSLGFAMDLMWVVEKLMYASWQITDIT
jgi:hypothetical protein